MCWNPEVSIFTFVFALISSIAAYYNGYNIKYLIFFMTFTSMQLIEFFLWLSLDNPFWNMIFSILGACLIFVEPLMSINILNDGIVKNILVGTYLLASLGVMLWRFKYSKGWDFSTVRGKDGHLRWNWLIDYPMWMVVAWVIFLIVPLILDKEYLGSTLALLLFIYSVYNHKTYGTWGSQWCYFSALTVAIYTFLWVIRKKVL